jgi:hypothetical protein
MAKSRYTTPVMRFVQGDVDEPQTKDQHGNPRVVKTGPNAGQPNPQYFVAGAVKKNDPAWPAFWAAIVNQAVADFPALFPQGAAPVIAAGGPAVPTPGVSTLVQQGLVAHPLFSFKVIDGDGYDQDGKANRNKEGFADSWVVRFASSYPPRCFHAGHYAAHEQIQEKKAIKRGFFIRVNGSTEGNGNAQRPGLYLNLDMVELAYVGPEIVTGPSAEDAFAGGPGAMPPGASPIGSTPAAPPPPVVPTGPQRPADPAHIHAAGTPDEQWWVNGAWQKAPAPAAPPPPAAPAATSTPPPPYTGFMPPATGNAHLPPAPGAPGAAPDAPTPAAPPPAPLATTASPSSGPVMLPAANGATYEQLKAVGWTDETLRQHGMMA